MRTFTGGIPEPTDLDGVTWRDTQIGGRLLRDEHTAVGADKRAHLPGPLIVGTRPESPSTIAGPVVRVLPPPLALRPEESAKPTGIAA